MQVSVNSHTVFGFTNWTYSVMISTIPFRVEENFFTLSTTLVFIIGIVAFLPIPDRDGTRCIQNIVDSTIGNWQFCFEDHTRLGVHVKKTCEWELDSELTCLLWWKERCHKQRSPKDQLQRLVDSSRYKKNLQSSHGPSKLLVVTI